ncbi:hypothetical protein KFL_000110450 [Klebsormidium nitens]|uniref:TraB family protein n=1 Tax=Klebsormidium nitens TaxID=105231 RepID=A0A1Y1HRA1_KLENI|nr:hypothetical protein KFL_000110450 [Klebsormidium nitens]|eukprot:GAQ78348.1 hypothetical protein KFL_000110450 [Klebsormidium nitens]
MMPRHAATFSRAHITSRNWRCRKTPKGSFASSETLTREACLIGTNHVSQASADDVRLLIEAVTPDVVAVEALNTVHKEFSGDFRELWSYYLGIFFAQALGVPYGCDFRSAIRAAERLGAHVVPIDQHSDFTEERKKEIARILEEKNARLSLKERVTRLAESLRRIKNEWRNPLAAEDAKTAVKALAGIVTAFLTGEPAPLDEIVALQSYGNKIMEASRLEAFKNGKMRELKETGKQIDILLRSMSGTELARISTRHTKFVAVVGAMHVQGIILRFAEYCAEFCAPSAQEDLEERFDKGPGTSLDKEKRGVHPLLQQDGLPKTPNQTKLELLRRGVTLVGASGLCAFACCKWPTIAKLGIGAFTAHGLLKLGLAALTAKWAEFGEYVEAASSELRKQEDPEEIAFQEWMQELSAGRKEPFA